MNYFIANLFRDWKYWAKIGFILILTLNVVDILSVAFAAPGYFNLWMVRITVIAGFSGLLAYYFYQRRRDKIKRQIEVLLPALVAERSAYFEKMIALDPKFQTFCFKCRHYDAGLRGCSLHLYDREVWIKLSSLDTFGFCLYWNLSDHPILDYTAKLSPQGGLSH